MRALNDAGAAFILTVACSEQRQKAFHAAEDDL
jgi:hypothetical protein